MNLAMAIQKDFQQSTMFLSNETDDGYGYVLSESERIEYVYAMFWAKDKKTVTTSFLSKRDMYDRAKIFVVSGLTSYSPNHIAQYKMYSEFIEWYESVSP